MKYEEYEKKMKELYERAVAKSDIKTALEILERMRASK